MSTGLPTLRWAQVGEYDAFWELTVYPDGSWEVLGGTYVSRRQHGKLSDALLQRLQDALPTAPPEPEDGPHGAFVHHFTLGEHRWTWRSGDPPPTALEGLLAVLKSLYAGSEKSR